MSRLANPRFRRCLAIALLIGSLIGWPVSALTWAADEPQFILGLSWLALTLTALDILATTDVRVQDEEKQK
jgi:hypothetical protein